jgi:nucleosome assembly protein 1-like 1
VENAYEPNSMNFTLRFHFAENDYFTNKVVEKKFIFENEDHPVRSVGTEIEWKQGRNITKKIQKKVPIII